MANAEVVAKVVKISNIGKLVAGKKSKTQLMPKLETGWS